MAAPNKTKETRTIVPGIWQDIMRTYDNLPAARLLTTTLTQVEAAIVEGDFYRTFQVITVLAASSSYIEFTAPADLVTFALVSREITPSTSGLWYRVRRNASGVVTDGIDWDMFNENGLSSKTSLSSFQNVVSVVDTGTIGDIAYIPTTSTGQKTNGSLSRDQGFKIIAKGTKLLLELENITQTDNDVLVYFQWIEAPAEVTG